LKKKINDDEFLCDVNSKNWENGIFYFLGITSSDDKKTWKSPTNFVTITASSNGGGANYPLAGLISIPPTGTCFCTNDSNGSWVMFTFKSYTILLTHYAIRARGDYDGYHLRTWVLEGSSDGQNWNQLLSHQSDSTLSGIGGIGKWKVNTQNYFAQIRIRITGPNSYDRHHLVLQSIEFYGRVKCV